jgi:alpha-mannosidase
MQTIHIISHTHWDREWYRTFQQFRLRLVHLVDGLLDILDTDSDYKHFMLDGQTIVLADYLAMRPEAESTLRDHIRNGRILIGPWHILPDMFLVSPEAHVRNLLAGDRESHPWGSKMLIGYMPDSFGHIGQMPQILRGFGIDNACLWRGLDDQPAEFWWQAPDGSRVLMLYLRDSYSNGAGFNASDTDQFTAQVKQAGDSLAAHTSAWNLTPDTSHLLIMFGTDHMEPPQATSSAIKAANQNLKDYHLIHSTLPNYLAAVQSSIVNRQSEIPTVVGELRSSKRSHLLPGVLSTRMWIKQENQACENLLEKWAEPFSVFASFNVETLKRSNAQRLDRPSSIVRQAWQLLMENHPHDSICGCSIDQVHAEMKVRFDQVQQIGEEITRQSLEALAASIRTGDRPLTADHDPSSVVHRPSSIIVFNPLSSPRTDIVSAEIPLPANVSDFNIVDANGNILPHQSSDGKTTEFMNVRIQREELSGLLGMINEGRAGNLAVQDIRFVRDGVTLRVDAIFIENGEPKVDVWNDRLREFQTHISDTSIETFHIYARSPESAKIVFTATDVPPLGWTAFYVRPKESAPAEIKVTPLMKMLASLASLPLAQKILAGLSEPKPRPPYIIENEFFTVGLNSANRTLTVTEKATGETYHGLNHFVDSGDCGDEYNFSPPLNDSAQNLPTLRDVKIIRGAAQQKMIISLELDIPASLSADRKSRSAKMIPLPITTTVTLSNSVPRVDIHTQVENHAKDHRLRVEFPFPVKGISFAEHDGHFEIVKRKIGLPAHDSTWMEAPRPETHQRAFTSVANENHRLTIANRGLPEVEVTTESVIALTLLRCVGWLSRDDFSTRVGHAGPFLETPDAQMIGTWDFDYAIILNQNDFQSAWNFETPLRAASTPLSNGTLDSSGSLLSVNNPSFIISAIKTAENGNGWIVRGYNISAEKIQVSLKPLRRFARAAQVNLAEETVSPLNADTDGSVEISANGHEVVSVLFSD